MELTKSYPLTLLCIFTIIGVISHGMVVTGNPTGSQHTLISTQWYNDPKWPEMWYWHKNSSMDLVSAWMTGASGKGIKVAVVDDGVAYGHLELKANFYEPLSYDYVSKSKDPRPNWLQKHGTKVAGVIAGIRNNTLCGFGVAPDAKIIGVRIIRFSLNGGRLHPSNVVRAFLDMERYKATHIFVLSFGSTDDGKTIDEFSEYGKIAVRKAATLGRNGKGSLIVVASGNGGAKDDCNCDGYPSNHYAIAVQSVGRQGEAPVYTERCAAALTSAYVGKGLFAPYMDITDMKCDLFTGTSAAAPAVAGILALALEKNPNLSRRDILHLVVASSNPAPLNHSDEWITNGAGLRFSYRFGFGLLNASRLVELAMKTSPALPPENDIVIIPAVSVNQTVMQFHFSAASNSTIDKTEYVTATITIHCLQRGAIKLYLTSPQGTVVRLLGERSDDVSATFFNKWDFTTPAFWDESPIGIWYLTAESVKSEYEVKLQFSNMTITGSGNRTIKPTNKFNGRGTTLGSITALTVGGIVFVRMINIFVL